MRKIFVLAAFLVMSLATPSYGADLKVAVCDLQKVVEQSVALKELYTTMQKTMDPIRKELEAEREKLAGEATILQDPKATKEQREKFITRQTEYMEKTTAVLTRLKESELSARVEMDKLVLQAAQAYAEKNKFDLVVDTQGLLFPAGKFEKATDITAKMVEEVNTLWKDSKKK